MNRQLSFPALFFFFVIPAFLACLSGSLFAHSSHDSDHGVVHKLKTGPKLVFEEESHDFGLIQQGDIVEYVFKFTNKGDEELIIENVEASCGCTGVLASSDRLKPGESGELKVSYDSTVRSGEVTRDIFVDSNDPGRPEIVLKIYARVDSSMHKAFEAGEGLFSNKCNKCHGEPAKGLKGEELFKAVCLFCHDYDKEKSHAQTYQELKGTASRNVIIYGIPGTEMPAFSEEKNGPLNAEQIQSILDYLND